MKSIHNERGIALVTALVLTLLVLAIVMALLYYVTQGVTLSAANKRYNSALEASYGGTEVFTLQMIPALIAGNDTTFLSNVLAGNAPNFPNTACSNNKLNYVTSQWGAICGGAATTPDAKSAPDVIFTVRGQPLMPNYNVFAKIIDTQPGNSDPTAGTPPGGAGGQVDTVAGVAYAGSHGGGAGTGGISLMHIPALYRIEVQGESSQNPLERGRLSLIYAY